MRALVTGGSGFVGTAVVRTLLRRGHEVVATSTSAERPVPRGAESVTWDAKAEPLPTVDFRDLDAVIHLAAPRRDAVGAGAPRAHYDIAVAATLHLLEACQANGVGRFLLGSTGDVLGPSPRPANEDCIRYAPDSPYGFARAAGELLVGAYRDQVRSAILRFFHPYGHDGDRFLVSRLVRSVSEGRAIEMQGDGGILLNPVWVDELADGVVAAAEAEAVGIFHFGGPHYLRLRELVEVIGEMVDRSPVITRVPGIPEERHACAYERSRELLKFNPRIGVREGLGRLLDHR